MDRENESDQSISALIEKIEHLRKQLHQLVGEEVPADFKQEEVYWLSQRLDKLIVEFMRTDKKKQSIV